MKAWRLTLPGQMYGVLHQHLFPGDGDEHGAVILAGLAYTSRGPRLLARELHLARDGVDYMAGKRGYRCLRAEFITPLIRKARDQRLVYLAIHNHGGKDAVAFSSDDIASHERGYPALLDIANGVPVGALVFARNAVAGDIWLNSRHRTTVSEAVILGACRHVLYPSPPADDLQADLTFDRQVRLFGDRGQRLLSKAKVAIIGLGGGWQPARIALGQAGCGRIRTVRPRSRRHHESSAH